MSSSRGRVAFVLLVMLALLQACAIPKGVPTELGPSGQGANDLARRCGPPPEVPPYVYRMPNFQAAQVVVEFDHLPSNETAHVRVQKSSGIKELDEAAVETVSKWKCELPARMAGSKGIRIPFRFNNPLNPAPPPSALLEWAGIYTAESRTRTESSSAVKGYSSIVKGVSYGPATTRVAAKLGSSFGVRIKVESVVPQERVSLRFLWKFPEVGLVNPNTSLRHFAEESRAVCTAGESCLKGWFLSEEWELVPGTWTLEAWLGDRLVATQSFELYRD